MNNSEKHEPFSTTPTKTWLKALNMEHIYDVFENYGFTTVGSLKEMRDEDMQVMFKTPNKLKLGEQRVLEARLRSLRQENLLRNQANETHETKLLGVANETNGSYIATKAAHFAERNENLAQRMESLKDELYLLELPVKEPKPLGPSLTVCGNCHHKGHRNDARHACEYVTCVGFHYCGNKKLHPEHNQKVNDIKKQIKQLEKDIAKGKETLKTMTEFESKSETYFFSEMTPRLKQLDWSRYSNKANLFKDLRILRAAFNGKVPEKNDDDKQFLKSILEREHGKISQTAGKFVLDEHDETNVSPVKNNYRATGSGKDRKRMLTYDSERDTEKSYDVSDLYTSSSADSSSSSESSDQNYTRKKKKYSSRRSKTKKQKQSYRHKQGKRKRRKQQFQSTSSSTFGSCSNDYEYFFNSDRASAGLDNINTSHDSEPTKTFIPAHSISQNPGNPTISPSQSGAIYVVSPKSKKIVNEVENTEHSTPLNRTTIVNNAFSYKNYTKSSESADNTRLNVDTLLFAASLKE